MKLASEMKRKNKQSINRGKSKETKAVHTHKAQAKGKQKCERKASRKNVKMDKHSKAKL